MIGNKIKCVIIINGIGKSGKDTLVKFVSKHYNVMNESSIDPIKYIASYIGWNGNKSEKSRKFLSDMKKLSIEFNDYPTNYLFEKYKKFLNSNKEIMFVHIREPIEIDKFKKKISSHCITLLIMNKNSPEYLNNDSDDNVSNYNYDFIYNNDYPLAETENVFMKFFNSILKKKRGCIYNESIFK